MTRCIIGVGCATDEAGNEYRGRKKFQLIDILKYTTFRV
ncbi:hypothetical protein JOF28_000548 [Leucobacter exalbidus]|uniref:Uncharacterized protein n=1 Tax=Leucobacter exalbidus TaxID=662960 RepID=A0A940PW61_9MICO|nr:hypothetical protein [Leucobacter exalbidus]